MKYIDLKELYEKGYLHEANRKFFHPLGLALEVELEDGDTVSSLRVQDHRDAPEGVIFDSPNKEKAAFIERTEIHRRLPRTRALGYWVQPLEEGSSFTINGKDGMTVLRGLGDEIKEALKEAFAGGTWDDPTRLGERPSQE